ncbi:MAG: lipopolysaccharide biosynthesis protein, partial [Planctomycetaceae bacterium]|nr:lipopolysaccharide biosynthesis protein [Planctomycetaceae bacterium]
GIVIAGATPLLIAEERASLRWSLWLGTVLVGMMVAQSLRQAQLRAVRHIGPSLISMGLWPIVAVSLASILFVSTGGQFSAPAMIGIQIVSITASWGLATWLRSRSPLAAARECPADTRTSEWMQTSITLLGVAVVVHMKDQMGVMLSGLLIGTDAAGVYAIAEKFAGAALLGVESLNLFTAPRFAALHATGRTEELRRLVQQSRRLGLCFAVPMAGAVWAASHGLLSLIEPGFEAGRPLLLVLLGAAVIRATAGPAAYALAMSGGERIALKGTSFSVLVNIALILVLYPWAGLMGIAAAHLLTHFVWAAFMHTQFNRLTSG